ncbi:programmed cell death 6-interacting protein isoform X4 [Octopus sinensis]|uniref:Programmed cell death 6-interacting protein isoform X4 n=1 Tax=Octopus sinensis TaxID=2607531 RepID=A0A6P7SH53_9MOLL|nr:programmed cell death 6-interacting protein isoform X4 [Octopus sinensis]
MASFLGVQLKKTYEVDLVKPMRTFIENMISSADVNEYNSSLNEFNKLRNSMMAKSVDKHESALEVLYRYYDQLVAIENKLPISENQIRILFKWKDAFDKESFFSGRRTLGVVSGMYEKVCMLFNIAALQSQIAASQNHDTDEGLKLSVKLFQQSAGIFGHLKDIVLSHTQQEPTPDLNPETLAAISALMLAQAQEAFYRKATSENMNDGMVAKLALQSSDLYADAMKLLQLPSIRELWPRDWIPATVMKQAAFHALAEYHQSIVAQKKKSYGEEIARLQHADELMKASSTRGSGTFCFRTEHNKVVRALELAVKDNDFIYHEKIPDSKSLPPIGKAPVAKPTPLPATMSSKFVDLFQKLFPLPVHDGIVAFDNRKNQIINQETGRLKEATLLLNSVLASLNLPAAIEDLSGDSIPTSLLEKAQQLKRDGGVESLNKMMQDLPELLGRNREILNESTRMLEEEAKSDSQLREQFKGKWTRTASGQLTETMKIEASKYEQILNTAIQADKIVQEKYNKHKEAILLLSKQEKEIKSSLPSANPTAALQDSNVVQELRKLMEQVETIKAEREVIEREIKDATFDISSKFLNAMAQDGLINEEAISMPELNRIFGPLREQVSDSINRQKALLNKIQTSNTEFSNAKASNQSGAQREAMLKDLAAGFDMYIELMDNLQEGTTFYNDLTRLLLKLQNKISDFCFARKTEKEELLGDLSKEIVNQPSQQPPQTPKYQQRKPRSGRLGDPSPPPGTAPVVPGGSAGLPVTASAPIPQTSTNSAQQPPPPPYYGGEQPAPSAASWSAPYPMYSMMPMPSGYNPYNPFMAFPQPSYPGGYPVQPPQYSYPGQQPPPQYPPQHPPPQQSNYPGYTQPQARWP